MAEKPPTEKSPSWEEELSALRRRLEQGEATAELEAAPSLEAAARRDTWRQVLRWTGIALIAAVGLWAVFLGGLWAWEHRPLPPPGTVIGRVVDFDGAPVPGAVISVEGFDDLWTTAQADGTFALPNVPGGAQWIRVELPGHAGVTVPVEVQPNQEVDIGTVAIWR